MTIVAPVELARRPQWVAWKLTPRAGETKPTKVPYSARTGRLASTTDPGTWSTFEEAAAYCAREDLSGVGYVLSSDDPYVGVDLDGCRDPASGKIQPWAKAVMRRLNSYTEISPSGTGLRIFIRGELPPYGRRKGQIEIYSQARFLTITGDHVLGHPETIQDRAAELLAWHGEVFGASPEQQHKPGQNGTGARSPIQLADAELLLKARSAANGAAFWALWNGDFTAYGSQSEADLALLGHLCFWTGPDLSRLDGLFRASGLMREKWDRATYRDPTINKALEGKTEFYGQLSPSPRLNPTERKVDPETGEVLAESPWRSLAELIKVAPDPGRQIVEGFLWESLTHWVYSGPGAGKTLTWLAVLMHVAAGKPFCGRAVEQGAVLLIEEDSPDSVISEYVQMLAEIYEIELEGLPFWINRLRGTRLINEAGLDNVRSMVTNAPIRPLVIALDACERLVPSESFNSRELDPLAQFFAFCQSEHITTVMIDHTRKPGGTSEKVDLIDLLYGGRTKSAISDVMMFFSGAIKAQATISFPKFRGDEPAGFTVSFDGSAGFTLKSGKPRLSESERAVMMVLNNAFGQALERDEIERITALGTRTTQRALNKLVEIGWAKRSGDNRGATYSGVAGSHGMLG